MTNELNIIANDIKTDAEKIWEWFEREIGLEHPAAKSLNTIVAKPTPVIASPESQASSVSGVVSGIDTVSGN